VMGVTTTVRLEQEPKRARGRRRHPAPTGGANRWRRTLRNVRRDKYLLLMIAPAVIFYILFCYLPMYGIVIAFKDFNIGDGIFGSDWANPWYREFRDLVHSYYFPRLLRNTIVISVLQLVLSFPVPILFALLLNEVKNRAFKHVAQTASYLPHFISLVVVVGLMMDMLDPNGGIVNQLLGHFGIGPIAFFNEPKAFPWLYVLSGVWQEFGWNSIIFFSAITAVNPELYESAMMDGANRFQRLLHVTLPALVPTIVIVLIINMGWMFAIGHEKIILMYNSATYETGDIFASYVYRKGLLDADYSFASAVGVANSVINIVILLVVNWIARRKAKISLF
jgi:putative aldouronate transport system permease protein